MRIIYCIVLLFMATQSLAQADSVKIFMCTDTTYGIYAKRHFAINFYSNYYIDSLIYPSPENYKITDTSRREIQPSPTSDKMTCWKSPALQYSLQFQLADTGKITIPEAKAFINGKEYACAPMSIYSSPIPDVKDIKFSFKIKPYRPIKGRDFILYLQCNYKPDKFQFRIDKPGIRIITWQLIDTAIHKGQGRYHYCYMLQAEQEGKYSLGPTKLTFGGTEFPLSPIHITIKKDNIIWFYLFVLLFIVTITFFWIKFYKEGKENIRDYVIRTKRLNLSASQAQTHYGLPLFLAGTSFAFSVVTLFARYSGDYCYIPAWIILIPCLLSVICCYTQYKKLFFRKVSTDLSIKELHAIIKEVGKSNNWTLDHVKSDVFISYTPMKIYSWGEQVFIVFDKKQIWINSICSLDQRSSVTSFGRTQKNIRLLTEAIQRKKSLSHA